MPKPADDPPPTKSEKQLDKAEKPEERAKKEKETKSFDKEDKKRRRKSKDGTLSPAFSEPPLKQFKEDKNARRLRRQFYVSLTKHPIATPNRLVKSIIPAAERSKIHPIAVIEQHRQNYPRT